MVRGVGLWLGTRRPCGVALSMSLAADPSPDLILSAALTWLINYPPEEGSSKNQEMSLQVK